LKSIYQPEVLAEVIERINALKPDSKALWGKMNAAQMMSHCYATLRVATGKENPPRILMGRLLGSFFKASYYNDKPWQKHAPTIPAYKRETARDFETEKHLLLSILKAFSEGGEEKCSTHPHPFFGKLTPAQHGEGQYKHIDHHLQQFGI